MAPRTAREIFCRLRLSMLASSILELRSPLLLGLLARDFVHPRCDASITTFYTTSSPYAPLLLLPPPHLFHRRLYLVPLFIFCSTLSRAPADNAHTLPFAHSFYPVLTHTSLTAEYRLRSRVCVVIDSCIAVVGASLYIR